MYANPSVIPSVQVGAGVPLQSTTMPQTAVQSTMAPVQSGSVLGVAPGTIVPVRLGNSIVHVPTQPVQTQTLHMSMQPQPQYQTVSVPAEPEVPMGLPENVVPAPQYGQATTPTLKTLKPRIIRKELPPQYKTRQLPAKVKDYLQLDHQLLLNKLIIKLRLNLLNKFKLLLFHNQPLFRL